MSSVTHYDYGFRIYNPAIGRFLSVDPLFSSYADFSPYNFTFNNPVNLMDPDGLEPIKPLVETVMAFLRMFNNTPTKMGMMTGGNAGQAMLRLGGSKWNWKQMRPLPTTTPYFNNRDARYIYKEKGGWIDMVHFLFYAGKAYDYKKQKAEAMDLIISLNGIGIPYTEIPSNIINKSMMNPVGEAVQDGYFQERSDKIAAKYSAYSYEDLPTDKFGADFGANYFDPNSNLTLGEQLQNYFNEKLHATEPENAPNYDSLPTKEPTDSPTWINHTTTPLFIKSK